MTSGDETISTFHGRVTKAHKTRMALLALSDLEDESRSPTENHKPRKKLRFRCDNKSAIVQVLRDRGWQQVEAEDDSWHMFWCDVTQVRSALDGRRLDPDQRIAHFRNHFELTRKNLLARNLKRLRRVYQRQGHHGEAQLCDCMPLTFELPSEYHMFVEAFRRYSAATWIVKPAMGCQGRGIFLFQRLRDLVEWRSRKEAGDKDSSGVSAASKEPGVPEAETLHDLYVVQRYVEKPYLVAGRKFDLRLYVLVTSFYPLKAWLSREGFARLSVAQFSLDEINDNRVHLTNTTIQLRASSSASEKGCKWSVRRLREFLTARHGAFLVEQMMQSIAQVVLTSLQSVQSIITQNKHCFELYGYDVLIDENLRPWLLEVNASPSLNATDRDDFHRKYGLLEDTINVLDFDNRLTGKERRVGGYDLLWNGGPVWAACPGCGDGCEAGMPAFTEDTSRLNAYVGCLNDRVEQLKEIWANAARASNETSAYWR